MQISFARGAGSHDQDECQRNIAKSVLYVGAEPSRRIKPCRCRYQRKYLLKEKSSPTQGYSNLIRPRCGLPRPGRISAEYCEKCHLCRSRTLSANKTLPMSVSEKISPEGEIISDTGVFKSHSPAVRAPTITTRCRRLFSGRKMISDT